MLAGWTKLKESEASKAATGIVSASILPFFCLFFGQMRSSRGNLFPFPGRWPVIFKRSLPLETNEK